jgi:hypothetical protein
VVVECTPTNVILRATGTQLSFQEMQSPTNALKTELQRIEKNSATEYLTILAEPEAVEVFRAVRKLAANYPRIDVGYDVIGGDVATGNNSMNPARPTAQPDVKPRPRQISKQPVFFECRHNQVFYIDKPALDDQASRVLPGPPSEPLGDPPVPDSNPKALAEKIRQAQIETKYYKIVPADLTRYCLTLEPKPDTEGDVSEMLAKPGSIFLTDLARLDRNAQYILFLVRGDSYAVFRRARSAAEESGFDVGFEILGSTEPIKFGTGGNSVGR